MTTEPQRTDKDLADDICAKVSALNTVIDEAALRGLKVDISTHGVSAPAYRHPFYIIAAKIERVEHF